MGERSTSVPYCRNPCADLDVKKQLIAKSHGGKGSLFLKKGEMSILAIWLQSTG
jgi:hypothetical protein